MSKITISAVLTVLRLATSLTRKIIRLVYVIIDLVDDGCVNNSVQRPEWLSSLFSALNTFEHLRDQLLTVDDMVSDDSLYEELNESEGA